MSNTFFKRMVLGAGGHGGDRKTSEKASAISWQETLLVSQGG